jgi:hypothetical protein
VGKFAIGLKAAFVDTFQASGDYCLQFPDLVLLLGVFRIHQCAAVTWASTRLTTDDDVSKIDSFAVGNANSIGVA